MRGRMAACLIVWACLGGCRAIYMGQHAVVLVQCAEDEQYRCSGVVVGKCLILPGHGAKVVEQFPEDVQIIVAGEQIERVGEPFILTERDLAVQSLRMAITGPYRVSFDRAPRADCTLALWRLGEGVDSSVKKVRCRPMSRAAVQQRLARESGTNEQPEDKLADESKLTDPRTYGKHIVFRCEVPIQPGCSGSLLVSKDNGVEAIHGMVVGAMDNDQRIVFVVPFWRIPQLEAYVNDSRHGR